jgi:transposase-like protein
MARTKSAEVWKSWQDRMRRYQGTDLTVAAFCDWEGVSQAAFYVWRKKLQADSDVRPQESVAVALAKRTPVPGFVQILPGLSSVQDAAAKVVMILVGGTRVEFPASDPELIAHVVLSVATAHSAALLQGGDR